MAEDSLKKKTIKGVAWSTLDNVFNRGISFIVGIILARLLSPSEYGIIGIVMIFIAVFNSIVDSGLGTALIRKQNCTKEDYNTTFYSNLIISIFMLVIFLLIAPLLAKFFEIPILETVAMVMSCIIIVNALSIIQSTIMLKNLDFKCKMKISFICSIFSGIVGILMAYSGFGVWSLVGQQISRQVLNTILLWCYVHWMPSIIFSWKSFRELFGFGSKLLLAGLINTIWKQIYQIVIGKCYSPATLGLYSRAHDYSSIFSYNITSVVQSVSFPALSRLQDDSKRLKDGYRKVIKITMLVTFCFMLGMVATAKPLIQILIGDKWLECVPFLQIICLQMFLYPLHAINLSLLQVKGRSDLFLKLEIIKKCNAVIPVLLGIFIGIYWMLWGSVIVGFIAYYINAYYSGPLLNYSIKKQIKDILPSFLIALIMALMVFLISYIPLPTLLLFCIQVFVGVILVITMCEIYHLSEYIELKQILKSFLISKTK